MRMCNVDRTDGGGLVNNTYQLIAGSKYRDYIIA